MSQGDGRLIENLVYFGRTLRAAGLLSLDQRDVQVPHPGDDGIRATGTVRAGDIGAVMLQSGLDISPVITHRFHHTDYEKGFEAMMSGQSGKVILNWE